MQVDLHCHSTASDGALAPAEVVARAHARGVRLLALTDHDTLEGIAEARAAAVRLGMQLVNGIELSSTWGGATIHVLGYAFSEEAPALRRAIADLHDGRWQRAEEIGRRLAAKGMPGALEGARAVQQERFAKERGKLYANGAMQAGQIRKHCRVEGAVKELLRSAIEQLGLSARAYDRILKVSRTIADLAGSEEIAVGHVAEAIQYRRLDGA